MKTIVALVVGGSAALMMAFGAGCATSEAPEQTGGSAAAETAATSCPETAIQSCMQTSDECNESQGKGDPTPAEVRACCIYNLEHYSTVCGTNNPPADGE